VCPNATKINFVHNRLIYKDDKDDDASSEETAEEDEAFRRKLIEEEFKKRRKVKSFVLKFITVGISCPSINESCFLKRPFLCAIWIQGEA